MYHRSGFGVKPAAIFCFRGFGLVEQGKLLVIVSGPLPRLDFIGFDADASRPACLLPFSFDPVARGKPRTL
jgi:hypothetical protein